MNETIHSPLLTKRDKQVLQKTLQVLTGKWRLLILYQLIKQDCRYSALLTGTPGISERILIRELNELVALGVLRKKMFMERPPRVEYGLTKKARGVVPLLSQLSQIGRTFLTP